MSGVFYKENNVFDESLERIRFIFNTHEDVIVSYSGGKDSTVIFNLALMVAKEKNRLPLKVFFLDQEAEWLHTIEQVEKVMTNPNVEPYWYQIPFDFTNSLSHNKNFLRVWDETKENIWIRKKHPISIKTNPTKYNRYHDLVKKIPIEIAKQNKIKECAVLTGVRMSESLNRRTMILSPTGGEKFKGITWCRKDSENVRTFYPIYDFTDNDVWIAIANNHWDYNKIYDLQYQNGCNRKEMRVSALIHETSWVSIQSLQEFEKENYNKFVRRIAGTSTFNHLENRNGVSVKNLPFAFKDWKEYRDYLLVNLVKSEYWDLFKRRWKNQNTEEYYKVHVKEILVNDIDGTINKNATSTIRLKSRKKEYRKRDQKQFKDYMKEKEDE